MHYTVKFTGTRKQRRDAAYQEMKSYLGVARFLRIRRKLVDTAIAEGWNYRILYRMVRTLLPFTGISGYWPTVAMARSVWASVAASTRHITVR